MSRVYAVVGSGASCFMSAADVRRMYDEMRKMRWVRREMDRGRLVVPAFVSFFAYYVILTTPAVQLVHNNLNYST